MKEVSCRVLDPQFRELEAQGLPASIIARNTPYPLSHFRNKHERIEWDVFAQVMDNLSEVWNDEEFIRQGGTFFDNPMIRPVALVGKLLFDPQELYLWFTKPRSGGGNQLFTCVEPTARPLGKDRVEISLLLPEGYRGCRPFFLLSKGTFTAMPRALARPPATVTMKEVPRGAVYDIRMPLGAGRLANLRRTVMRPFLGAAAAKELEETHLQLVARYEEIDGARAQLDRQATQLRTAHTISTAVHGDLDLRRVVAAVAEALVEVAGFAAAEIDVEVGGSEALGYRQRVGATEPKTEPMTAPIASRDRRLGTARMWPREGADPEEREALLAYVVPTISMAIENATTYAELADYRDNLELRVADRTRQLANARDELQRLVKSLEQAQASRDRIFANINHELRTPLSNIALAVDELREHAATTAGTVLDGIDFNVSQLLHLIDGLLLLAAGQEGRLELRKQPVDVVALCKSVISSWMPAATQAEVVLALDAPTDLQAVVDPDGFARVLQNLLSNAIKYTPSGGRVAVTLGRKDEQLTLQVADTGVGVAPELREQMFARFVQGPAPVRTAARGAGIGLAIVAELINAHEGTIAVESEVGQGTTFRVLMPLVEPSDHDGDSGNIEALPIHRAGYGPVELLPEALAAAPGSSRERATATATVLVAEDDPQLRRHLVSLLSRDVRVLAAPNGERALALAEAERPDMLVTDISMPRMDGHELARRFRQLPGNRLAPILMLTAHGHASDKREGFDSGAIDYLLKPFDPHELRQRVAAQLRQRELAVRLSESEKLSSLAVLSAGLAHEFRNPANGIVNAVDVVMAALPRELTESGTVTGDMLEVIGTSASQLRALCGQLLGFVGPGELSLTPQPLTPLIERASVLASGPLEARELRLRLDYDGDVACAPPFFVQLLVNLIDNAAAAAGEGGWVEIQTSLRDGLVVVRVSDSGPGVPVALRDKIFQPFFTTRAEGTGLGLAVAQQITKQHGGRLELVPRGGATAFELLFPLPVEQESMHAQRAV